MFLLESNTYPLSKESCRRFGDHFLQPCLEMVDLFVVGRVHEIVVCVKFQARGVIISSFANTDVVPQESNRQVSPLLSHDWISFSVSPENWKFPRVVIEHLVS